jgi:uncharacterized hydrophobic protein (TIGR00271 family)
MAALVEDRRMDTELPSAAAAPLYDARQSLGPAKLDDLFPEGKAFRRSVQTYVTLLALAGLIASFGLYQDSVASIIGAMVVAPLGGAIMALAGALVTGRTRWQGITLLEVLLGSLMVVVIGFLVSLVIPDPLTLTPALEARTHPGILDLGVALAAGAAGAYVAARRTGSDALPGVAIAVSLVPPLATVGICMELGRMSDALGALTLFLTNFSAIVVVASIVFVIFGNAPSPTLLRERHRLRNGFLLALVVLCIVAVPLVQNGLQQARTVILSNQGAPIVRAWIGDRDLTVVAWSIEGEQVTLDLTGTEPPAPAGDLAKALAASFGQPVEVLVSYSPLQREQAAAP